jgi:hypothetical protein
MEAVGEVRLLIRTGGAGRLACIVGLRKLCHTELIKALGRLRSVSERLAGFRRW